jgi:hypothetical protein
LTWAFQIGFVLSFFLISCSLVSLCIYERNGASAAWLGLSCLCPLAAAMNLAAGILAWPALLLLCFFLRARAKTVVCISLSAILATVCYFRDFHWGQPLSREISRLSRGGLFLRYITTYFGTSWWVVFPHEARAIAFASFLLLGYLIVRASRDRSSFSVVELFLLSECFCLFLVACATAFGRMSAGAGQASQSRYQTPALLFWACLFCALMIQFRRRSRLKLLLCTQMLIALIGVKVALDGPSTWAINERRTRGLNFACQAFVRGKLNDSEKRVLCEPCDEPMLERSRPILLRAWKKE